VIRPMYARAGAPAEQRLQHSFDGIGLEVQVQRALNLFLPLKNPRQMLDLLASIEAVQDDIDTGLASLHYVHFARFLPTPDGACLMVLTEFDGDLSSYLMDFVAVLGDQFNVILSFIRNAPPLPVQRFAREFVQFVHDSSENRVTPWSAYPLSTVIDIQHAARAV
jgi:hypothetical protein